MREVTNREAEYIMLKYYPDEDRNYYHDIRHVRGMLEELPEMSLDISGLTEEELNLLKTAILFHDAVYVPGKTGNEIASSDLALKWMDDKGAAASDKAAVDVLIKSTEPFAVVSEATLLLIKEHGPALKKMIDIIHDLDWMAFRNIGECRRNDVRLVNEALHRCPDRIYHPETIREGRVNFLEKLLDWLQDHDMFFTKTFSIWNEQAVVNVRELLEDTQSDEYWDMILSEVNNASRA